MTEKTKEHATAKGIVALEEEHLGEINGGFEKKNGVVTLPVSGSAAAGGAGAPQSPSEKFNDLTGATAKVQVTLGWGDEHKFR